MPTVGQPEKRSVYTRKWWPASWKRLEAAQIERAGRRRFDQERLRGVGGKAFCARCAAVDHNVNIVCDGWLVDHLSGPA